MSYEEGIHEEFYMVIQLLYYCVSSMTYVTARLASQMKLNYSLEEYLFGVSLLHMPIILREVYMSYGNSWVNLNQYRIFLFIFALL
jgi:hypothetical protein